MSTMGSRADLSELLHTFADNVYFQPPNNLQMKYPCIVYKDSTPSVRRANNNLYLNVRRYTITVIDKRPESPIVDGIAKLSMCTVTGFFVTDNLNHTTLDLYF